MRPKEIIEFSYKTRCPVFINPHKTIQLLCLFRRRLPVIMVKLRMAQAVKDAVKYIEQGHILQHSLLFNWLFCVA